MKVPPRLEIENYIKSQPDYKFSIDDIVQHLSGNTRLDFTEPDVIRWMNAIRAKVQRIRDLIAESEKGRWVSDYDGRNKFFTFLRNTGGEVKQTEHKESEEILT